MKRFGWIPDLPDQRDLKFEYRPRIFLPKKVSLKDKCPPVMDQGDIGSCTGHGVGAIFMFDLMRQSPKTAFRPSRLMLYYNGRVLEGSTREDAGAMIRDVIKGVAKQGVCPEVEWPYIESRFDIRPPDKCYAHAQSHQAVQYKAIPQTLKAMKQCLVQGFPFTFGFTVYESIDFVTVERSGYIPMPKKSEAVLGGHCMYVNGYDDDVKIGSEKGAFIGANSWGERWGFGGYFAIPYAYLTDINLAADFWTIRLVETD